MKTASFSSPSYHIVDTAPLAARYEVLVTIIHAMITARRMASVLRYTQKMTRLVRVYTQLDRQNELLARKLDMLSHKPWRDLVLKELGGLRKLKLWEAAQKRIMARIEARKAAPPKPAKAQEPAWLYTAERIAESERLKARVRECGRASAHPRISRDRFKMDFDGHFRLAPLPRGERAEPQMTVYTKASISDYSYNEIPYGKVEGFGPAIVWPKEFYAAIKIEAEILEGREKGEPEENHESPSPLSPLLCVFEQTTGEEDKKEDAKRCDKPKDNRASIPLLPLHKALSPKVYHDFFGSLTR